MEFANLNDLENYSNGAFAQFVGTISELDGTELGFMIVETFPGSKHFGDVPASFSCLFDGNT